MRISYSCVYDFYSALKLGGWVTIQCYNVILTDIGELMGVEWCLRGAHMNGDEDDMSRLPVEPDGL